MQMRTVCFYWVHVFGTLLFENKLAKFATIKTSTKICPKFFQQIKKIFLSEEFTLGMRLGLLNFKF